MFQIIIRTTNQTRKFLLLLLTISLIACGGGGGSSGGNGVTDSINLWTWISGSNVVNQDGNYGTQGIANAANVPGVKENAIGWTDNSGNFWLFGGEVYYNTSTYGIFNDLWRWDGSNWTWISGSNVADQSGTYGTQGIADATNVPGARYSSVTWTDTNDDMWLFGGVGYDSVGSISFLNDLWRWDGTNWAWISGSNIVNQDSTYGTIGIADAANVPGARSKAVSWIDANDDLWMFGGRSNNGYFNDLWRWDGTNWTWISGSNTTGQSGTYGTKGTADAANVPGARNGALNWIDDNGDFWIFGGYGYDSSGTLGLLNDLWRWDGINWTWISGSNTTGQSGTYGIKGVADAANVPGARFNGITWTDTSGNFWLLGGDNNFGATGLNDLWRWDGTNWTWISGANTANQIGTYGTIGVADAANVPGGRQSGVSWIDVSGNLWLFGGAGYDSAGDFDRLNDFWRYQP